MPLVVNMAACCLLSFMLDTVVYVVRYYMYMCSCRCAGAGAGAVVCTFRFWDQFSLMVITSFWDLFFFLFVFLSFFCHVFPLFSGGEGVMHG